MLARSRSRFRGRAQPGGWLSTAAFYGATDAWDFTTDQYLRGGTFEPSGLTVTRASSGYAQREDGIWESFGSGVLRRTDKGALIEGSRINRALHSRDLTQAAWAATNVTVARNQVGIDGAANSACSLTATAGNGTVLQAVTHASTARYFSIWIRRITGTGTVEVTLDNGSTWTAVTVTSAYTRVGAAQTLANPTVGVRIVTSGDAVAVDFAQLEDGSAASSPIGTAGTAVTRAADDVTASISGVGYPLTLYAEMFRSVATGAAEYIAQLVAASGSNDNFVGLFLDSSAAPQADIRTSASSQAAMRPAFSPSVGAIMRFVARAQTDNCRAAANTVLSALDTTATMPSSPTSLRFGARTDGALSTFNYVRRVAVIPRALTDADLQGITT